MRRSLITIVSIAVVTVLGAVAPASAATGPQVQLLTLAAWGSTGTGNGQLADPQDVALDPGSGNVYVADTENDRVQRFTADGTFLNAFNLLGLIPRAGTLQEPVAITVGAGGVFVEDRTLGQIVRYSLSGTFLNRWNVAPREVIQFCNCAGREDLASDVAGNVYVLTHMNTVEKYSPAGASLLSFSGGSGYSQGIAVEADGEIVVTGYGGRISTFSAAGAVVSGFQTDFSSLMSLAIDPAGNLWTFNATNARQLLSFTPGGTLRAASGAQTSGPQFSFLGSVAATTTAGIVYTTDWSDHVQKIAEGARLLLVYNTDYNESIDRTFTVSGPGATQTFLVDEDTDPTLSNTAVTAPLVPGTWHVDLGFGAQVKTITCSNGVQTADYAAHAVDITLAPNQTVTCTFYAEWIG